ncbi:MFS transporter [Acetobacteroides hydrogenigenes]|uniref:Maltose/moltooligosaccharide transporter n=1 Tax=Acetobacteroides hydrogenigenes TaxID=979970 RepID=A0A4R2E9C5_9BACT|nr:MFS transporter [Acetobacteroides hydrogenigenes]TCN64701.1 maltose/moltooligosaccharide transporter [Acetobacteroides hydrogenigenes]
MKSKPKLSFWQIWNLSFGFLGVQAGFALQNANVSRILSNFGADLHHLSFFWLVAPIMGLVIQPWVGAASDRTWNRLGRRKPFILGGAIAATLGMFLMPNANWVVAIIPPIIFGAIMLALMDASFNVTFQPFRSLVADMTPGEQTTLGYSVQTFLINVGAIIGSFLPYVLTNFMDIDNTAPEGQVPDSVIWSFYLGGGILLLSVLWTVFRTKEYAPKEFAEYQGKSLEEEKVAEKSSFFKTIVNMPAVLGQLAVVQFFSWFALFTMWVYTTPAVAQHIWGTPIGDSSSAAYNEAANWVGVLFGLYSVFAALFSIIMNKVADSFGRKRTFSLALFVGALGFLSIYFFKGQYALIFSMVGVGIAWAAILAMPYAILSQALPAGKTGVYMGIFNITVVVPQIISGILSGTLLKYVFHERAIYMIIMAGISWLLASMMVFVVKDRKGA